MNRLIKITGTIIFILTINSSSCIVTEAYPQSVSVSFQVFYDALSPYGRWVEYPPYGFGWIPVGYSGFYPYATGGYWAYTDYGWMWISYYSWGWAPYHYGSWVFDVVYGWIWIPGNDWGPAWVVWSSSPGYYGWIPMMPGYGYHIHSYPAEHWTFVSTSDFGKPGVYYGPRTNNAAIMKNSRIINNQNTDPGSNSVYYSGPRVEEVQKVTGREFKPVAVESSEKPNQVYRNNQLKLYMPRVDKKSEAGKTPAPARVTKLEDIKQKPKKETPPEEKLITPRDKTDVIKGKPAIIKEGEKPIEKPKIDRKAEPIKKETPPPPPKPDQKPGIKKEDKQQVTPERKPPQTKPQPQQPPKQQQPPQGKPDIRKGGDQPQPKLQPVERKKPK